MKTLLKYLLVYILLVVILILSFSKGLFLVDYNFILPTILFSMGTALLPAIIFCTRNKPLLMTVLFILSVIIVAYLHIQTLDDKFSIWFKEEQIRQFITMYALLVISVIIVLYRKYFLKL
jgi:hypothetical protein